MNLLSLSGSLRAKSSNTAIVRALAAETPQGVRFTPYAGLGELPPFNPDLDTDSPPETVRAFRAQLKAADGIVVCTPEYAFGIPGALKNALDWAVSSGEFQDKPVIAISASPSYLGGDKALASLVLTLGALGAAIPEEGMLALSFIGKKLNPQGEVADPGTLEALCKLLAVLMADIRTRRDSKS